MQKLLTLMRHPQLSYGAADFVVTSDGRCVFLEVNPAGEIFWLEKYNPDFPLSSAIADCTLAGQAPSA